MNRRKFVTLGATSLCVMPVFGLTAMTGSDDKQPFAKPDWLVNMIHDNDAWVKKMAAFKVENKNNPLFGAYFNNEEIINPHSTCAFIKLAGCALASPESVYYHSASLIREMSEALTALLQLQHADGTIDLMETNFHSTPDTAFMVKRMALVYPLLVAEKIPGSEKMLTDFAAFLQRAGEALITGGIHTPNHRWVVSAALTRLHEIWPDKRYENRINEWLGEHIDIDPDGQYTEKSTYGYSALVDRVLITIANGMHKPILLDAVRKNLRMMHYYIHPNGEVVTEASNRQDKGQIGTMENYYYAARYMALLDHDGEMAAICKLIENESGSQPPQQFLDYFLAEPFLWKDLPAEKPLPVSYVKNFPYSGVVRIRRNEWDATLLTNNAGWLTFHKKQAVLQAMRIAASFFGKGQFQTENIIVGNNRFVLTRKLEGDYFQPYPKDQIPADGDMAKMPRTNRKKSNIQYLTTTITVAEAEKGIRIDIDMSGTDRVPVSMELIFRKGGKFSGVQPVPGKENAFLFSEEKGTYTVGSDTIHFGPGKIEHKGIQLRGALPAMDAPTVYLTGLTPFRHTLYIS